MPVVELRRKYRVNGGGKSQKSKSSNSGGSKKNRISYKSIHTPVIGAQVKLINFGEDIFCAQTGLPIARRGMVWRHNDKYFVSQAAIRAFEAA